MIGLKPYPEARTITLPWLQTLPPHWDVRRIKTLLREYDSRTKTGEERLLSLRMREGIVDHLESGGKPVRPTDLIGYKVVEPGVLIMNRMRASSGLFGVASTGGLVSPDYATFRPASCANTSYLLYLFKTPMLAEVFRKESRGLGTGKAGFLRLYTDRFGAIGIPLPPIEEQQLIGRFLDKHGALTARLVREKQRLIKLLEEQKQAIVHRAVTRGLDPNVRLKPSGIPSLGEVPHHCEIRRLRNVADVRVSNVDKKSDHGELPVRLCNYVDVYKNDEIDEGIDFMHATASASEIERFRIRAGDVVITKDSEDWRDIGVPSYVSVDRLDLVCGYHLALLRPITEVVEGRFLYWQLLGASARWQFSVAANGVTRYGLSHGAIKALVLVLPPLPTQLRLTSHLDDATRDIRVAQRELRREIALIQELRSRLVVDVVTGKLVLNCVEIRYCV
jgi:type I restriction enzyme, S subunit